MSTAAISDSSARVGTLSTEWGEERVGPTHASLHECRLRDVLSALGADAAPNGSFVYRQRTSADDRVVVVNPLVVARQTILNAVLAAAASRSRFATTVLPPSRRPVATWLVDDLDAAVRGGDDLVQRLLNAGLPARCAELIRRGDIGSVCRTAALIEGTVVPPDLPIDRPWLLHLCTVKSRRDELVLAALLRRELRHAGTGGRALLVVVGTGTDRPALRRLLSGTRMRDDVVLLGEVHDPSPLVAASDAVVLVAPGTGVTEPARTARVRRPSRRGAAESRSPGRRRTIILGSDERAIEVAAVLKGRRRSHEVVGFLTPDSAIGSSVIGESVLGTFHDLYSIVESEQIKTIIIADEHEFPAAAERTLFDLKTIGLEILAGAKVLERFSGRVHIEAIRPIEVIYSDGFRRSSGVAALKRVSDAMLAAVGLVALAPLFGCIGLVIHLDSGGPIFYRQLRIGLNGKPFSIWKFRSMRADAEQVHAPVWASADDPRVTRVGKVMRKWRLDELPQIINVLRGDMSLVGPRPERPLFVQELRGEIPYYDLRHTVRPGITGWAQVRFRYAASPEESREKLHYDLYYVKHRSLALDLRIATETIRVMTRGEGAR